MLINTVHAVEPLLAKRHERWVAFVLQVLTTCYLHLYRQKKKKNPGQKNPQPPRDAHVNRAWDPISCHKGFRTCRGKSKQEDKPLSLQELMTIVWLYIKLEQWHWTQTPSQMLWAGKGEASSLLTEMKVLAICPLSHLLQPSHRIKLCFNYLQYSFT